MSEMWQLASDTGSPLLTPLPRGTTYAVNDYPAWNICPIDNSYNYQCFHLPGVTDAPPSSPNATN